MLKQGSFWAGAASGVVLAVVVGLLAGRGMMHDGGWMADEMHVGHEAGMGLYDEATREMHEAMVMAPTGDADVDFMRGMLPHHEGAVAMARIVLEHGADAEVRKLAEDIVAAQEREIRLIEDWLKAHGAE